jgi:ABC-type nickel/cobalt efflux system permease component RcnA
MTRQWISGLMLALLSGVLPHALAAHPLGNFSINQYSALTVGRDGIAVRYVIDMAEIPTFQELQDSGIVADPDHPSTQNYLERKVRALGTNLSMEMGGRPLKLYADSKEIVFPPGAGGLPTLRIAIGFLAPLSDEVSAALYSLQYRDGNFPGRPGWKEIIARSAPGTELYFSSVPETDRSAQLTNYAADLLNSPPQELAAQISFAVATAAMHGANADASSSPDHEREKTVAAASPPPKSAQIANAAQTRGEIVSANSAAEQRDGANEAPELVNPLDVSPVRAEVDEAVQQQVNRSSTPRTALTDLMAVQPSSSTFILVALIVAVGLGAFHALEPGHGKTLVAAYLVGSRGTMRHALLLGLIVTAAHTAGVYLLGGVALYASRYIVPERLYPGLEITSGILIAVLGTMLLIKHYRGNRGSRHHHGEHGWHTRLHDHSHQHEHPHVHDHVGYAQRSHLHPHGSAAARELLTLGISGGIVPCPAALVVLLSSVSMNRAGFGLLLIVAFSAGLAAVLVAIGILIVSARQFMLRWQSESTLITRWLPITSSAFIISLGIALVWKSLQTTGFAYWQL